MMLTAVLMLASAIVGFVLGRHSVVRIDLGEPPVTRPRRTVPEHVIFERRPLLIVLSSVTVVMLLVSVLASVAWIRAGSAQDRAAESLEQAQAAIQQAQTANEDLADFVACYVDYQEVFVEGYTQRIEASEPVSAAIEDVFRLIRGGAEDDATREEFNAVVLDYLETRRLQRKAQKDNPAPVPPKQVCGDTPE